MSIERFAPSFEAPKLDERDRFLISPFFSNLDRPVFCIQMLPQEVIGALCSRTSRAEGDLRDVFLREYVRPFLDQGGQYADALAAFIEFLHRYPAEIVFSNPKARLFYIKWLSQFGDDSIAQMSGIPLIYAGLSQVAIKQIENMRIGIAPIEKSTRYVDYSSLVNGRYRYYESPTLSDMGFDREYVEVMDNLFKTYTELLAAFMDYLRRRYPGESEKLLKTKAFDTVRTILPTSTISQLSLFGNGQAFEYMYNRCREHNLGEIRWSAQAGIEELRKISPSFFERVNSSQSSDYRRYLSERAKRIREALQEIGWQEEFSEGDSFGNKRVRLIQYDPDGENKIIAGLIYSESHEPFEVILAKVRSLPLADKERILQEVFRDRRFRWYKVPRAFENVNLRFEIEMNIGAWRDLHRHRMHTQQRQRFSAYHGFDTPGELEEAGLSDKFRQAVERAGELFLKIEERDRDLAQYCPTLAHRMHFFQWQNMRAFFWEGELRTIPQGHPDYRKIEQEKIRLVRNIYPLVSKYLLADMTQHYDFARRGTPEEIAKKEAALRKFIED